MVSKIKQKPEGILPYFEGFCAEIWHQIGARVKPIRRDAL